MIILKKTLVFVGVTYYIPKSLILNEFYWQTDDSVPDLPRVHAFLNYWHDNIEGTIKEVRISSADNQFRLALFDGTLN